MSAFDLIEMKKEQDKEAINKTFYQYLRSLYGLDYNAEAKQWMKCHLNSMYGTASLPYVYTDTDSIHYKKENKNMRRNDYLVVHIDGRPALVTKSAITAVRMSEVEGKAIIETQLGCPYYTDEKYSEIAKRLFE